MLDGGIEQMDAETCLEKLKLIGVLDFATIDADGNPQIRNISAIHYEKDTFTFFTARGKNFCQELLADGRVQVLGYTKYKEMIRVSGKAAPVATEKQKEAMDQIFLEQPYLSNVYPGKTREIGIVFQMNISKIEYFNLGVNPIFRQTYLFDSKEKEKGYQITNACIGCGTCQKVCPQKAIQEGKPFVIQQEHCLHCGNCFEHCPVQAIIRL